MLFFVLTDIAGSRYMRTIIDIQDRLMEDLLKETPMPEPNLTRKAL